MPIVDVDGWNKAVDANQDPYGGSAIIAARRVMELLDAEPGEIDADKLMTRANDDTGAGLTGYLAGCVASIVSQVHSRGDEFRRSWNKPYGHEGDGVVNPAIMTIGKKE